MLQVIRLGSRGEAVEKWQHFLKGEGIFTYVVDGIFGPKTEAATKKYQRSNGLEPDSVVGQKTYIKALKDGYDGIVDEIEFPPKPGFLPLVSVGTIQNIFGKLEYELAPTPNNKRRIRITNNWDKNNIVKTHIPNLKGVKVGNKTSSGTMYFHKKALDQLRGMWAAWGETGLSKLVLTYEGSFNPRVIGGTTKLSNHAFGIAIDINYKWNKWGHIPALDGTGGSVRELVPIANEFGFYWGGHFSKKDGMHFEVAKLLSQNKLSILNEKYN